MMAPPRVSILTPAFNHRDYIERCLASVLAQSYPYWEMIVIDDASTDDTAAIVARYADHDPRISLRRHTENLGRYGIATAFNEGLDHSTGRYVAILEGDDYWPRDKLETQVTELESRPDAVLCHGKVALVRDDGVTIPAYRWRRRIRENRPVGTVLKALLPGENPVAACTTVIRRAALEKIGGFQPRPAAQGHRGSPSSVSARTSPPEHDAAAHPESTTRSPDRASRFPAAGPVPAARLSDPSDPPAEGSPGPAVVPQVGLTDYPTWMDLAAAGPFLFVPGIMGYWRRHASSVIHRHQEALWTEKLQYMRYFLDSRGPALESLPAKLARSRARAGCLAHLELCRLHLLAGRRTEAAAEFTRAWASRGWFFRSPRRKVRLLALGLSCHGLDLYRPLRRLFRRRSIG